jgi:orotate phosphoribosyltransferase
MTDADLIARIQHAALLEGEFTLRSGRTSRYYLDKYRFTTQPDLLQAIARRMADHVGEADLLAGPELGGVPIATAVALHTGLPFILVRNQKKGYGTAQQVEGQPTTPGQRIVICEDIATTGGQAIEAATMLRDDLQLHVQAILCVIDRQEGAREAVESAGFRFHSVLTKADLGIGDD